MPTSKSSIDPVIVSACHRKIDDGSPRYMIRFWHDPLVQYIVAAFLCLAFAACGFGHPGGGIAVDSKGRVYFTDTYKGVQRIDERGITSLLGGEAAHWMVLDEYGKWANGSPSEFGRVSLKDDSLAVLTNPNSPCAIDAMGTVYFLKNNDLYRRPVGKEATILFSGSNRKKKIRLLTGLTTDPSGSLYVLNMDSSDRTTGTDYHSVLKVDGTGAMTTVAENFVLGNGDPLAEVRWGYSRGLAVDEYGNVFVAGTGSRSVYRINPNGKVELVLKSAGNWSPTGVAVRGGELFVLEYDHTDAADREWEPRVKKVDSEGKITILAHVRRKQ